MCAPTSCFKVTTHPALAKHSKRFCLQDAFSVGVDRMQRNFEPMLAKWRCGKEQQLPDATAKLIIYRAFVEGALDVPKHVARRRLHELYFEPQYPEFSHARCGACQTPSLPPSKNWTRFPSSRPLPNWETS